MKNTILYIMCMLFLAGAVVMQSCSSDSDDVGSAIGNMRKRDLTLNLNIEQFNDIVTRAGSSFENGATVYIDFGGVKGTSVYNGGKWTIECPDELKETQSGTCNIVYIENPSTSTSSSVNLTSASIVYEATGTYKNTVEELSVTASLSPSVSRIHFRGKYGSQVKIKGLKCYKQFNKSTYALSSSTDDISLSVKSDGYTDYVYCLFASSSNQLSIVNDLITYTRSFGSNVLRVGHSGYINIPTEDSYSGWESDNNADNISIDGSDYDSSESDWNQTDPDRPDDITIGGEDYNGDEDWNQADSGSSGSNMHNGHEYVDLGLPSGLKWATCNVGASKPEEYGNYYAWGETASKMTYDWSTYIHCKGSAYSQTKYCTDLSYGNVDNKTILDADDDAAHVNWGGSWRIPTKEEQDELHAQCSGTWASLNGVDGYKMVGPNGKSLFLPAAGYRNNSNLRNSGSYGYYWSSSLSPYDSDGAYNFIFSEIWFWSDYGRSDGLSVRAVCP